MGGWVLTMGRLQQFQSQIEAFRRTFTISGVPPLNVEAKTFNDNLHAICWSWSKPPVPDIGIAQRENGAQVLLLHGYITGFGRFGSIDCDQLQTGLLLLELWNEHGHALIPEINGSFSLVFFNTAENSLTIYTDRLASRSVWFSREGNLWYASNFPSAIAAVQETCSYLDPAGLWALFATSRHVGSHGIFHGIQNIHAGQLSILRAEQQPEISQWWQRRYLPKNEVAPREWGERIAQALCMSAKKLEPVTPDPHLFLSGGLDSRITAAAIGGKLKTHTLCSQYNMDARLAAFISHQLNLEHQTIIRTPYWYLDTFEAAALIGSGNFNIAHAHFIIPVQQIMASNHNACFFLGDLLENFNKHYFHIERDGIASFVSEKLPDIYHKLYPYTHPNPDKLSNLFQPKIRKLLREAWREEIICIAKNVLPVSQNDKDKFDTLARWANCSFTPTYNMIECIWPLGNIRSLMFDNNVIDLHLTIPADTRGNGVLHPRTLWHLNKALLFIPNSNYWLPPVAPKLLTKLTQHVRPCIGELRRKIISLYCKGPVTRTEGAWPLLDVMYRSDSRYHDFIQNCLYDKDALPSDIFDPEAISACWREFLDGDSSRYFEINMLLSFGFLHRRLPTSGLKI
jgi:asparagine synthase (glutamine-hydrolysing)